MKISDQEITATLARRATTAPEFVAELNALAVTLGEDAKSTYRRWLAYVCECGIRDQSPVFGEFTEWLAAGFNGRVEA